MTTTVSLPLWLLVLILLFAAVTFASHFLFPSVRWFFRKRAERLVGRLNQRLQRPIEPFKLARRHDMIQRLIYDPQVTEAIVEHARSNNVPENVAFELARDFAREIVPSFSATAYFTIGARVARWLARSLYRIRLGSFDRDALERIDPNAAVIFVINHRSNMDYVLVTYLVSRTSALSYAVGEWARIWPLSAVIRAMGAYFIRRRDRSGLYRRVLARYVQMAVAGGVTQAFFPEGGLSLSGRVENPKLGLLNYIVSGWSPDGRDVIFVPVGLNYDRVLEDRFLIAAHTTGKRRFRPPLGRVISALGGHFWQRVTGRFKTFGTASVSFGAPLSLANLIEEQGPVTTEALAQILMGRVRHAIPVLPVPLVAEVLRDGKVKSRGEIEAEVAILVARLSGFNISMPRRDVPTIVRDAIALLLERGLVTETERGIQARPDEVRVLAFYANSIGNHLSASSDSP